MPDAARRAVQTAADGRGLGARPVRFSGRGGGGPEKFEKIGESY